MSKIINDEVPLPKYIDPAKSLLNNYNVTTSVIEQPPCLWTEEEIEAIVIKYKKMEDALQVLSNCKLLKDTRFAEIVLKALSFDPLIKERLISSKEASDSVNS